MISPISNTAPGAIDPQRVNPPGTASASGGATPVADTSATSHATPGARLAALGPPIDMTRVAEIKAAIAEGSYTVDADRLAAAMLALDLPPKKA
jgi:negative regulator of flagellin synthesis FlgM